MTNLIAKFPGAQSKVVMVTGHYDTKLEEDFRFVGANDGASSAALLLELARDLHGRKHDLTYWLVFFDGEEAVRESGRIPTAFTAAGIWSRSFPPRANWGASRR